MAKQRAIMSKAAVVSPVKGAQINVLEVQFPNGTLRCERITGDEGETISITGNPSPTDGDAFAISRLFRYMNVVFAQLHQLAD